MSAEVVAAIFARGGSKGVPGKNIRPLAGKPLIAWAIEAASASRLVNRVIVSTDDPLIAETATRYGAEVPFLRPPELARDDSPEILAWQHAIRTLDAEPGATPCRVLVSVPATAPMRAVEDIDASISTLLEWDADAVLAVTPAARSPYFNMVTLDPAGSVHLVIPTAQAFTRRQDAPPVYDVTTVVYAAKPSHIMSARSILDGHVRAVVVPADRAIDIDTELDFEIAEFLMNRRLESEGR